MRGVAYVMIVVVAGMAALAATSARAGTGPPPVTVIGDSVLTAVEWQQTPTSILEQGLDVKLQVGICRTLTGVSCPFDGETVPTLMDLVTQLGSRLGPTVLVEVGYNDNEANFAEEVEQSIDALLAAGVRQILWANMHIWQQQYVAMNAVLAAAARTHPEVKIIDWASYSNNQYSWFQGDGIHLDYAGAVAMATLFNGAIKEALAPPVAIVSTKLSPARVGRPYSVQLVARGGSGRYTWKSVAGPLPAGLRLLANGRISGIPRRPVVRRLVLSAVDSRGQAATKHTTLVVRRRQPG